MECLCEEGEEVVVCVDYFVLGVVELYVFELRE